MRSTDNIKCCIALQHKIKNKGIQVQHDSLLIKQSSLCGVMHDTKHCEPVYATGKASKYAAYARCTPKLVWLGASPQCYNVCSKRYILVCYSETVLWVQ